MQTKYNIRQAKLADAEGITQVQRDSWLATYPNKKEGVTIKDIQEKFKNMNERITRWESIISEQNEDKILLVYEQDNQILGFCGGTKEGLYGQIKSIYIQPNFTSKGLGSKLMVSAINWLQDIKSIKVEVASYNKKAISFYQKFGFVKTDIVCPPFSINENISIPIIEMERIN
jgi:ribosomal protein S18 acetylase RimI-like enzyme